VRNRSPSGIPGRLTHTQPVSCVCVSRRCRRSASQPVSHSFSCPRPAQPPRRIPYCYLPTHSLTHTHTHSVEWGWVNFGGFSGAMGRGLRYVVHACTSLPLTHAHNHAVTNAVTQSQTQSQTQSHSHSSCSPFCPLSFACSLACFLACLLVSTALSQCVSLPLTHGHLLYT